MKFRRHVGPVVALHEGTRASRNVCACAAVIEFPLKNSASLMM